MVHVSIVLALHNNSMHLKDSELRRANSIIVGISMKGYSFLRLQNGMHDNTATHL